MYYAVFVPPPSTTSDNPANTSQNGEPSQGADQETSGSPTAGDRPSAEELIFEDIKQASAALKRYRGSRMKTFQTFDRALAFLNDPDPDESFMEPPTPDTSSHDLVASLEKLSLNKQPGLQGAQQSPSTAQFEAKMPDVEEPSFPTPKPAELAALRRAIESGDYEKVEETVWANPRTLCTVCDSATYLMAGPKYNACHIAARANRPDLMALILDTVSNTSFLRKLYPKETDDNIHQRVQHLLDSYLNTPDPRQGNTPLHFACKLGYHRVVRVLLTYETCDVNLKDSAGLNAVQSICAQKEPDDKSIIQKMHDMFKSQLHLPTYRDQLKKRLLLAKRRNRASEYLDSDNSFSDDSFIASPIKAKPPTA